MVGPDIDPAVIAATAGGIGGQKCPDAGTAVSRLLSS